MTPNEVDDIAEGRQAPYDKYILKLYITGMSPNCRRAIENIKNICEEYLKGNYELSIIDMYQEPGSAKSAQIIAAPTLIKIEPAPIRKLVGDMSDKTKVLRALGIMQ